MTKLNIHTTGEASPDSARALARLAFAQAAIDYAADAAGLSCDTEVTLTHKPGETNASLTVTHNGRRYKIPYGAPVSLPACIAGVLRDANIEFSQRGKSA